MTVAAIWTRVLVITAVAAVISNAHCVDNCATVVKETAKSSAPKCPLHKPASQDTGSCDQPHAQLATEGTPQTAPVFHLSTDTQARVIPTTTSQNYHFEHQQWTAGESPHLSPHSRTVSILRI